MERRAATSAVIRSISSAMTARGETEASVAEAADITLVDLSERLHGDAEFTVAELVHVSGFLRLSLDDAFSQEAA
ncbi:hypothetical protein HUN59_05380 [Curtobacterium sp. Csp2]|uniref:hypothetical protein n=1 Tax=Curtobacterium sp. Csp2 TaxID=2495430 RepID=UPI0015806010|nr:hypothetical protein [Curtobacterium sp. Csp2]QKS15729.1 hypothetical protein HUN59_05380 [Curtobacterium sp. Csp2]